VGIVGDIGPQIKNYSSKTVSSHIFGARFSKHRRNPMKDKSKFQINISFDTEVWGNGEWATDRHSMWKPGYVSPTSPTLAKAQAKQFHFWDRKVCSPTGPIMSERLKCLEIALANAQNSWFYPIEPVSENLKFKSETGESFWYLFKQTDTNEFYFIKDHIAEEIFRVWPFVEVSPSGIIRIGNYHDPYLYTMAMEQTDALGLLQNAETFIQGFHDAKCHRAIPKPLGDRLKEEGLI
jgi:hypothetical protein